MPSAVYRAAREYAERGVAVFPVRNKYPIKGSHGENDGTTDPAKIDEMWRAVPDADVAAALRFTPYFVLDIDGRNDGHEHLARLVTESGPLPEATVVSISGSGWPSCHLWFKRTQGLSDIRCRGVRVPWVECSGIDVKGLHAGYVVLPPSSHASGGRYTWAPGYALGEVPVADPPAWLSDTLRLQSRRVRDHKVHAENVTPDFFYWGAAFHAAGWLGPQIRPGVFAVRCPNRHTHSCGEDYDGSTVIFAPRYRGGRGVFFCSHAHCEGIR